MLTAIKNHAINYLVLLYAFSLPLSLDVLRATAISIIIVWIIRKDYQSYMVWYHPVVVSLLFLVAILTLSLLWTTPENLKFGIKYIERYWYLLPMLTIFTSLHKTYIKKALSAFLLGMLISELVSYAIFFKLITFPHVSFNNPSPFMQHTLYSVFLVITAGILLTILLTSKHISHKLFYGLFFFTVTGNLFINSGRTGYFLYIVVISAVLLSYFGKRHKWIVFFSLPIVFSAIFITAYNASPNFHQRMNQTYYSITHLNYTSSIGSRLGLLLITKEIATQHPLFGVGVGDYLSEKSLITRNDHRFSAVKTLVHYHNQYAEFTVIAGIFGLLAYIWMLTRLWRIPVDDAVIRRVKIVLVLAFAVASLTDAMFHLNRPLSLFALLGGLILAQHRIERETNS